MVSLLINILRVVSFVFIARAILSWFQIGYDSPMRPLADLIVRVTEPVLSPIRSKLPPMGGIDLSILLVIFGINLVVIPIVSRF